LISVTYLYVTTKDSLFRPSIKELLAKDFFAEDTGFKVELAQREELVKSDKNDVNFRLRYSGFYLLYR
jgi:uncharacterized protein YcgL (UPF0745 family)